MEYGRLTPLLRAPLLHRCPSQRDPAPVRRTLVLPAAPLLGARSLRLALLVRPLESSAQRGLLRLAPQPGGAEDEYSTAGDGDLVYGDVRQLRRHDLLLVRRLENGDDAVVRVRELPNAKREFEVEDPQADIIAEEVGGEIPTVDRYHAGQSDEFPDEHADHDDDLEVEQSTPIHVQSKSSRWRRNESQDSFLGGQEADAFGLCEEVEDEGYGQDIRRQEPEAADRPEE